MGRDERALRDAREQSAAVLTGAGFPRMPARALMALMVSESGGLTARELAGELGVSAAAVSGAVRYLQTVGVVRRIAQHGSRRDRYELADDTWYAAALSKNPVYAALAVLARQVVAAIGDPASSASVRAAESARFYHFLSERMPALLEEWQSLRD